MEKYKLLGRPPTVIQGEILEKLFSNLAKDDIEINSPYNPVAAVLDASTKLIHSFASDVYQVGNRASFLQNTETQTDLYGFMSDYEYSDIAAIPAKTKIALVLDEAELYEVAPDDDTGYYKTIIIPETTKFILSSLPWIIPHPIRIRIHKVTKKKTIEFLTDYKTSLNVSQKSDNLDFSFVTMSDYKLLVINIPIYQAQKKFNEVSIDNGSGIAVKETFDDYLVSVKVDNKGKTLRQTLKREIYDNSKPTAYINFDNEEKTLECEIPYTFIKSGEVSGLLKLETLTTSGPIDIPVKENTPVQIDYTINMVHSMIDPIYVSPLTKLGVHLAAVKEDKIIRGGRKGLSYQEIKDRLISRSLSKNATPISPAQLKARFFNRNYGFTRLIDDLTDRLYLATNILRDKNKEIVQTAIGKIIIDPDKIDNNKNMLFYGDNVILKPSVIFEEKSSRNFTPISNSEYDNLDIMSTAELIKRYNEKPYFRLPFYSVISLHDQYPVAYQYSMANPKVDNIKFFEQNDKISEQANPTGMQITHDERNSRFVFRVGCSFSNVSTGDPENILRVYVKLKIQNSEDFLVIDLDYIGKNEKEIIFEGYSDTDYLINDEAGITLSGYSFSGVSTNFPVEIEDGEGEIIIIGSKNALSPDMSDRDLTEIFEKYKPTHEFVTRSGIAYSLGRNLSKVLYTPVDTRLQPAEYVKYDTDIYHTYLTDVFKKDENGIPILDSDNKLIIEHHKGDQVLDSNGDPLIKHKIGDIKTSNGDPVILKPERNVFYMESILLDGRVFLSQDRDDVEFINEIGIYIKSIEEDLDEISSGLTEKSEVRYRPDRTLGMTEFLIGNEESIFRDIDLSFEVKLYVVESTYLSSEKRESVKEITVKAIKDVVESAKTVLSIKDILGELNLRLGNRVSSIDSVGISGNKDINTLFIKDANISLSVNKKLYLKENGKIALDENIEIEFLKV